MLNKSTYTIAVFFYTKTNVSVIKTVTDISRHFHQFFSDIVTTRLGGGGKSRHV